MSKLYRFYLVDDSCEVWGTDDLDVAIVAKRDGVTVVLEPRASEATFDGNAEPIRCADRTDWLDEDLDEDGGNVGEED